MDPRDIGRLDSDDPALTLADALEQRYGDRITARIVQPARAAQFRPMPDWLDPALCQALASRGIVQLYSHQAEALALSQAGHHVVVVTPTASGKSLCYHLPVLSAVRARGSTRRRARRPGPSTAPTTRATPNRC